MRTTATACSTRSRDDPDLIFADIHEDGRYLYPGTGRARRNRPRRGRGHQAQHAVAARRATMRFRAACGREVLAHLREYEPEFILLQCGADSLEGDPITHLRYSRRDAHARAARDLARAGRRAGPRPRARHGRRRL